MRKIKVLEMIDKPFLGGGQVHLLSLARSLDQDRFEVFVSARGGGPLEDEVKRVGLRFLPIPLSKKMSRKNVGDIRLVLQQNEIDILHTHGGVAGFFGRRAATKAGTPVIVHTLHGIHYLHYRNPLLKFLYILQERHFSRRTDAVIFVSDADIEMGKKHRLVPEGKRRLIKNGVDIRSLIHSEELGQKKEDLRVKFELSPPVIGTVARLHRQKGILYLLRAAKEIHGRHPEATIVVVGGGPLEESLRRQAAKLELGRNFLMLGERTDAREILSLFDIFVLPSLWEGLPLVLIEAAALGKPMIATDIDGVREVIRNGENGILVPPRDPAKLAESVIRLIEDPSLATKLGVNAEKEIPHLFPLSRMVEKTQQLYLELTKKTRVDP